VCEVRAWRATAEQVLLVRSGRRKLTKVDVPANYLAIRDVEPLQFALRRADVTDDLQAPPVLRPREVRVPDPASDFSGGAALDQYRLERPGVAGFGVQERQPRSIR